MWVPRLASFEVGDARGGCMHKEDIALVSVGEVLVLVHLESVFALSRFKTLASCSP